MTTYDAVLEWLELVRDVSQRWGPLMDEAWLDLPPEIAEKLMTASRAFADAGEALNSFVETHPEVYLDD